MSHIENGLLTLHADNGDDFKVELSQMQLMIICKILGFEFHLNGTVSCYDDNGLKKLSEFKGNPLQLKRK